MANLGVGLCMTGAVLGLPRNASTRTGQTSEQCLDFGKC